MTSRCGQSERALTSCGSLSARMCPCAPETWKKPSRSSPLRSRCIRRMRTHTHPLSTPLDSSTLDELAIVASDPYQHIARPPAPFGPTSTPASAQVPAHRARRRLDARHAARVRHRHSTAQGRRRGEGRRGRVRRDPAPPKRGPRSGDAEAAPPMTGRTAACHTRGTDCSRRLGAQVPARERPREDRAYCNGQPTRGAVG